MSDIHPGTPRDDADRPHFTVEDSGSTSDPADLVGGERAAQHDAALSGEPAERTGTEPDLDAPTADAATTGHPNNLASLLDDGSVGHVFDQTNGVVEGLDGDSDGSAESDVLDRQEREDENPDLFHDADVRGIGADDSRVTGN